MSNTTVSKITISKDNATKLVSTVRDGLALVNKGYLAITPQVARLYDTKAFEVLGYRNFDELCMNEFGMSHGTTVGIRKVFARFGTKSSKDGAYSIPEQYLEWGYTKLLLFATDEAKFKLANIDPLTEFNPNMTIGEMRSALKLALDDKANDQEKNAIDTDGSIIDNSEAQDNTNSEAQDNTNSEAQDNTNSEAQDNIEAEAQDNIEAEVKELTPLERMANLISEAKALKEMTENNNWLKPEKLALFDAIIANAKDLEKLLKKAN